MRSELGMGDGYRGGWSMFVAALVFGAAFASGQTAEKPATAGGESQPWYTPLKNIPIGPGTLNVGFSVRARYEYTDNFNVRGYGTGESDELLLLRTRLSGDYKLTDTAHAYVELQDARYWLSDLDRGLWPKNCPFEDQVELRQAFLEWRDIGGTPFGFKAGRQSISYADRRVFGPGEWGNVGRYWWDAAELYVSTEPVQLDLLYGRRVTSEPSSFNDSHYPFHMLGAYAQFEKQEFDNGSIKPDVFYLVRYDSHGNIVGESGTGDQKTHTLGFCLDGTWGKHWDFGGTLACQTGTYGQDDIRAYGYNARAGYTFDAPWKPRLAAEFSYASGDDNTNNAEHATFDGVFGAVDCFYGRMNLLPWMNLEDYQATAGIQPCKGLKLWADYHVFRLAEDTDAWYWASGKTARIDRTGAAGGDIGQELDLLLKWQATKNVELFAGYSHFFTGTFLERTEGSSEDADWAFLQAMYSF